MTDSTTVFCPPGLERGEFAIGVLDYFCDVGFPVSRLIGASGGALPTIAYATGKTKECIEEFCNVKLSALTAKNNFFYEEVFGVHRATSIFTNDGWREFFGGIEKRHNLLSRLKNSPCRVELLAADPVSGDRIVLIPKNASSTEEFIDMLLASSALVPLWPAVNGLVDGVFAPVYFFDEVMQNPEDTFLILRGDPPTLDLEEGRKLKNWVSITMRNFDLLCAYRINNEIARLGELGILGKRVFILSHDMPLPRVNIFLKSRENALRLVEYGRLAAQKFLTPT